MKHSVIGFDVWRGSSGVMKEAHTHSEVEMNLPLSGGATYFLAGRFQSLSKGRLALFWAGMPHQLVGVEPGTEFIWVTVPLAWLLQWQLPVSINERLFSGELIEAENVDNSDAVLLSRWVDDLRSRKSENRSIVMLEVEARVRRMALASRQRRQQRRQHNAVGPVDRIIQFISQHYTQELSIGQIARAVHLHPNYAMQMFKRQTGMRLWDYVIRLRIAHSQRLLLTTDGKIVDVALDSGFGSVSRFHEAFSRVCGQSPRRYRFALRT